MTPTTLICRVPGEDRRFIHALGIAQRFTGEPLPQELLPDRGVVLAGGYLKLRSWKDDALRSMFRAAREKGCKTVLNVCIPQGDGSDPDRCWNLLPEVDIFLPNEDEARLLTGLSDPSEQARRFRAAGARVAIVTRGSQGLYADDGRATIQMGVFPVKLVDPSGCGDCFSAGLIAALVRGWELVEALRLGSAVGALCATALGCTTGVPSFAEAERFLRQHADEQTVEVRSSAA